MTGATLSTPPTSGGLRGRFHRDPLLGVSLATWLGLPGVLLLVRLVNPLGLYVCPFKASLGVPCLSCGTTRMMVAAAGGDLLEAFTYQPLGFTVPLLLLVYLPLVILMPERLPDRPRTPHVRTGGLVLAAAALLNWSYLIIAGV